MSEPLAEADGGEEVAAHHKSEAEVDVGAKGKSRTSVG